MMPERKTVIIFAAKIYAASVVGNSLGCGASSDLMTPDEEIIFHREIKRISKKIFSPSKPITSLDDAILYSQERVNAVVNEKLL